MVFYTTDGNASQSEVMRITADNYVGIGLTDPNNHFMVGGSSGGDIAVARTDTTINDGDTLGNILFKGKDDGGSGVYGIGAKITALATEAWNEATAEGTSLNFYTTDNTTATNDLRMTIDDNGNVGIGTTSPDGKVHIESGSAGTISTLSYADELIIENSGATGISIRTPDANSGNIMWQTATNDTVARIVADYNSGSEFLAIEVDGSERMRIDSSGNTTFAGSIIGNATNFDIKQTSSDGSDNRRTRIGGGGDVSQTRGAYIELAGNEHTNTGQLILNAGDISGGDIIFKTDNTTRLTIDDTSGSVGINETSNANMTTGLTINQGAADNEILAFKSSDVAHGRTSETETDTYMKFGKRGATYGGGLITAFGEATGEDANFIFSSIGGVADTTKSSSARGLFEFSAEQHDGSNSIADIASNGNVFAVKGRVGGAYRALFVVDEDGDLYADGGTSTDAVNVYDEYNDSQLLRTLDLSRDNAEGLVRTKFDEFIEYNDEKLAELGIVGREEDGTPNQYLNVTGLQRLHNGAIWQQYTEMQKMKELMYDTMVELIGKEKADAKLKDHDIKLLDETTLLN